MLESLDLQAPQLIEMFADGTALLRLSPVRHLTVTKYFVVVVPDVVTRLRDPSDFRPHEVFYSRYSNIQGGPIKRTSLAALGCSLFWTNIYIQQ